MEKDDINVSLDSAIALFKFYDCIETTDKKIKNVFFADMRKLAVVIGTTTAFVVGTVLFKKPLFMLLPTIGFGSYALISYGKDMFKSIPKNNSNEDDLVKNEEVLNLEEFELELNKVLENNPYIDKSIGDFDDGLDKINFEDIDNYYSDDFKLFNANYKPNKQLEDSILEKKPNIKLLKNKEEIINKNEAIIKVIKEIDIYKLVYNLPKLTISNKEWDILVNNVYNFLVNESRQSEYYEILSFLVQFTFAKCIVKKFNISMVEFVNSLKDILPDFSRSKVIKLQKKILEEYKKNKIIKVDFTKKKTLK